MKKPIETQRAEMHLVIASAINEWNRLENALAQLLNSLISNPHELIGYAIYFTPQSTEVRISIVFEAIQQLMIMGIHPDDFDPLHTIDDIQQHIDRGFGDFAILHNEIIRLKNSLRSAKNNRNSIVHGSITLDSTASGDTEIRLTKPTFNYTVTNLMKSTELAKSDKHHGLSIHEVKQAKKQFSDLIERIDALKEKLSNMRVNH